MALLSPPRVLRVFANRLCTLFFWQYCLLMSFYFFLEKMHLVKVYYWRICLFLHNRRASWCCVGRPLGLENWYVKPAILCVDIVFTAVYKIPKDFGVWLSLFRISVFDKIAGCRCFQKHHFKEKIAYFHSWGDSSLKNMCIIFRKCSSGCFDRIKCVSTTFFESQIFSHIQFFLSRILYTFGLKVIKWPLLHKRAFSKKKHLELIKIQLSTKV